MQSCCIVDGCRSDHACIGMQLKLVGSCSAAPSTVACCGLLHVWAHHGGGLARVVACACKWASSAKLQCVGSSSACTARPARGAVQDCDSVTVGCCCRKCSTQFQSVWPCAVAARGHTACIAWWWTCGYLRALFSRRGFAACHSSMSRKEALL